MKRQLHRFARRECRRRKLPLLSAHIATVITVAQILVRCDEAQPTQSNLELST
jgi:hypothetical protein